MLGSAGGGSFLFLSLCCRVSMPFHGEHIGHRSGTPAICFPAHTGKSQLETPRWRPPCLQVNMAVTTLGPAWCREGHVRGSRAGTHPSPAPHSAASNHPLATGHPCHQNLGFPGGSVMNNLPYQCGRCGSDHWVGEGNGNSLQYSCLENPMDRGAWLATVHGVPNSWT